jgi:hypothetical protein
MLADGHLPIFLALAESALVEYQRTAAQALASFSLVEKSRARVVRQGGLRQILACCLYEDLQVPPFFVGG